MRLADGHQYLHVAKLLVVALVILFSAGPWRV